MLLHQNCSPELPSAACDTGNIASVVSTVLWFSVLVPQVVRNQSRRSVAGLNPLWAVANFSASLCNLVFMFSIDVPVQFRIMAVYMPVVELGMLGQFWLWYDWAGTVLTLPCPCLAAGMNTSSSTFAFKSSSSRAQLFRGVVTVVCVVVWSAIIAVQLVWPGATPIFAWAAIALWSVETFPQLYTNIITPRESVAGQSVVSIIITCFGKTTGFTLGLSAQHAHTDEGVGLL